MKKVFVFIYIVLSTLILVSCKDDMLPTYPDFQFFYNDGLEGYVVQAYTGDDLYITVPESYQNVPVKRIHPNAFTDKPIVSLTLPKTIDQFQGVRRTFLLTEIIFDQANPYYTSIDGVVYTKNKEILVQWPQGNTDQDVTIDLNVKTIGAGAFIQTYHLKTVTLHDSVIQIEDAAFQQSAIQEIQIDQGSKLETIGKYAFDQSNLSAIYLPDTLKSIGEYAFRFTQIKTLFIPHRVDDLELALEHMYALESIDVDSYNYQFVSDLGVLYSKNYDTLIAYPLSSKEETLTIPLLTKAILPDLNEAYHLKNIISNSPSFKSEQGVLYNAIETQLLVFPKQNATETLYVKDSVHSIFNANLYASTYLNSIIASNMHPYFASDVHLSILYNKSLSQLLFYPKNSPLEILELFPVTQSIDLRYFEPTHLKTIVAKESPYFYVDDLGIDSPKQESYDATLYKNKDKNEILYYPYANDSKTTYVIRDSVYYIGQKALENPYIEAFDTTNNARYFTKDGVLYEKVEKGWRLVKYPNGKKDTHFQIPKEVTEIASYAFYGQTHLNYIAYENGINALKIEAYAFYHNKGMEVITLPSFTQLEPYAIFEQPKNLIIYLEKLTHVHYAIWEFYWNVEHHTIYTVER